MIAERLLRSPRRTAGVDVGGEPVRLGERDSEGWVVGYVDDEGAAWPSLVDRMIALASMEVAEAMALPEPQRRERVAAAVAEVPAELHLAVFREASRERALRAALRRAFGV